MDESRIVLLGVALWLVVYALMLDATFFRGALAWELMPWGAYSLVWEWFDALNLIGGQTRVKRILHLGYAVLDTAILYPQLNAHAVPWLVMLGMLALRFPRHFKYFHWVWNFPQHLFTAALPAYRHDPLLKLAIWLQAAANACYIPKWRRAPEGTRRVYWWVSRLLPLWGIAVNIAVVHLGLLDPAYVSSFTASVRESSAAAIDAVLRYNWSVPELDAVMELAWKIVGEDVWMAAQAVVFGVGAWTGFRV